MGVGVGAFVRIYAYPNIFTFITANVKCQVLAERDLHELHQILYYIHSFFGINEPI